MQSESRWTIGLRAAALVMLVTTVCALPWIHGGNIPLARLILQVGSVSAAVLSLASWIIRNERTGFPSIIFPLGVLAAVGVIQLTPVHAPMVNQMNRAVLADLRPEFIDFNQSKMTIRTASPADTRLIVAQLVALMLLALTAFDQIRTRRTVIGVLTAFTANASVLSLLAFVQLFQQDLFLIRDEWWTGMGLPFGTFVNPNNAAGWLVLGLASAIGLLILQLDTSYTGGEHAQRAHGLLELFSGIGRYAAALTSRKVMVWFALAVIACAIAGTRSRGGMVAAATALIVTILVRLQIRRLAVITIVVVAGSAAISSLMVFLNLHQAAFQELQTLRDPAGELSARLRHWYDSIPALLDFPVLGGGLGAYRYVTLPYQTRDAHAWFQNADNQYIELLVEAGIIGAAAFLMLGLPILIRSVQVIRLSVVGAAGRSASAVALMLVFATTAQAVSALVDFGAGLPSTSALFVVLVSMLAGVASVEPRPSSRLAAGSMRIALIAAAVVFVGDLTGAHECYVAVIAGKNLPARPVSLEGIQAREILLDKAANALKKRSDDARTNELVSKLLSDIARSKFLKGLPGLDVPEQFRTAWPHTACLSIARRIDSLSNDPKSQEHLKRVLSTQLDRSGLPEHSEQVILQLPLLAPVVGRAARWSVLARTGERADDLQNRARFIQPSNGQFALDLGELMFRNGDSSRAVAIWKQALVTDESLRYRILAFYSITDRLEAGLEEFGPSTYVQAIRALRQSKRRELTNRLRHDADRLWAAPESPPTVELLRLRDHHLRQLGDLKARIEWLEQCVAWQPDMLQFHYELATAYSAAKRWSDSEDQWYQVLRLDAANRSATRGIAVIKKKRE